jgi:hypothetical protein
MYSLIACLVLLVRSGMAQPLEITVAPLPPFPPQAGIYFDNPGRFFNVVVTNTSSQNVSFWIGLRMEMSFPDRISLETPVNMPPYQPVTIGPHQTLVLDQIMYRQLLGHLVLSNIVTRGFRLDQFQKGEGNLMPEGTYQACITAYEFNPAAGVPILASRPGSGCTSFTICYTASAPEFITPVACLGMGGDTRTRTSSLFATTLGGDVVQPVNPLLISWRPPAFNCAGPPAQFSYSLKMVEVMPGQNIQSAIDYNPEVLRLDRMVASTAQIDTNLFAGMLRPGQRYAMQVTATPSMRTTNIIMANQGKSPVCSFVWGYTPSQDLTGAMPLADIPPESPPPAAGTTVETPPADQPAETPLAPFVTPEVISDITETTDPNCLYTLPVSLNTSPFVGDLVDQQVFIGHFTMTVKQATLTGDRWQGNGQVHWSPPGAPAPLRVWVQFTNLQINSDRRVIAGEAYSWPDEQLTNYIPQEIQRAKAWGDGVASYAQALNVPGTSGSITAYQTKMNGYYNYLEQKSAWLNQADGIINLPVALKSVVPTTFIDIGIIGMAFTPTSAKMNTIAVFEIPESGITNTPYLAFVGQGMCFTPNSLLSGNEGAMFLAGDLNIRMGSQEMIFKRAVALGDTTSGTFIKWDNSGFKQARIEVDVLLPQVILPENAQGTPVRNQRAIAQFSTHFRDWHDWIATASITTPFQIDGLPDFTFTANNLVYDNSVKANFQGIQFPVDPSTGASINTQGTAWKGFYMRQLAMQLPPSFALQNSNARASYQVNHLVIDQQGDVSLNILAVDPLNSGIFGGCAFAIDTIRADVILSEFYEAYISGDITLPVGTDPLRYTGFLRADTNHQLDYAFGIHPASNINIPIWAANLNIDEGSGLSITKDAHGPAISFTLQGDISLQGVNIPNTPFTYNMPGIKFTDFTLANRKADNSPGFYFHEGNWSQTSAQKSIGPFDVSIDPPKPYLNTNQFGLSVKTELDLEVFQGSTTLTVYGNVTWQPQNNLLPNVDFGGVQVEEITVDGEFGPVEISGVLNFYRNQATFGDGIKGKVRATFSPIIEVDATAVFGKTAGSGGFRYWYVDAMARTGYTLPLFYPLGISGFGGGVYHNMEMSVPQNKKPDQMVAGTEPTDDFLENTDPSQSASGTPYLPKKGTTGFKAGIMLALTNEVGGGKVFNGSLWAEMSFSGDSFDQLRVTGDSYFMSANYPNNDDYLAMARCTLLYDNSQSTLDFDMDIKASFLGMAGVDIPIRFHAQTVEKKWYLMLGDPHGARMTATLIDIDATIIKAKLTANAYIAFGNALPNPNLPDPPEEIMKFLNLTNLDKYRTPPGRIPTAGLLFGAGVDGSFDLDMIIYCSLRAIAGFDIALTYNQDRQCLTSSGQVKKVGYKGWYGEGQIYGYFNGDVGIKINVWFFKGKVSLCKLTAGAFLRGGIPDPFWAYGKARVKGSVLGGLIKISTSVQMDIGEKCTVGEEDPLAAIRILEEIQPGYSTPEEASRSDAESVYVIPRVTANLNLSSAGRDYPVDIAVPPADASSAGRINTYKFFIKEIRHFLTAQKLSENPSGGRNLTYQVSSVPNSQQVSVTKDGIFEENRSHAIRVVATALQWRDGRWQNPVVLNERGEEEVSEKVEVLDTYFRTGPRPDNFEGNMLASYPLNRQRYAHWNQDWMLMLQNPHRELFNDPDRRVEAWLRKLHVPEGQPPVVMKLGIGNADLRKIQLSFDFWKIERETMYELAIIRIDNAQEAAYIEQMNKENRRLIIKSLLTNQIYNSIMQGGVAQLSQTDLSSIQAANTVNYEDLVTLVDKSYSQLTGGFTSPQESSETTSTGIRTERTGTIITTAEPQLVAGTGSTSPSLPSGTMIYTGSTLAMTFTGTNEQVVYEPPKIQSSTTVQPVQQTQTVTAVQPALQTPPATSPQTNGGTQTGSTGVSPSIAYTTAGSVFNSQPAPSGYIVNDWMVMDTSRFVIRIDPLTVEEYNALHKRDTIDIREQVLVDKFESAFTDTLFTIVFGTSRYASVNDKVRAFGDLTYVPGSGSFTQKSYALSANLAEPYEEYDFQGLPDWKANMLGYITAIPPLIRGAENYRETYNDHRFWRLHFADTLHYLARVLPQTSFKPRTACGITVNTENKLKVEFGSSAQLRRDPRWPLSPDFRPSETMQRWWFPSMGRRIYNQSGRGSWWDQNGDLGLGDFEIRNGANVRSDVHIKYQDDQDQVLPDDIFAVRSFGVEFKKYADLFNSISGKERNDSCHQWIERDRIILRTPNHFNVQISMGIEYLIWLDEQWRNVQPVKTYKDYYTAYNMHKLWPVSRNYNTMDLLIEVLDIANSRYLGTGDTWEDQGWDYKSGAVIKLNY